MDTPEGLGYSQGYLTEKRALPPFAANGMRYLLETAPNDASGCRSTKCGARLEKGMLRVGEAKESASSGSFMWRHVQCLTGKSVRKMKETYSTEDYATVPGYDMLTTENQEAARVAFNKALAQQEIMDSVKNQAEAEKAEKAAMRKRKNERREMDISQVDWMQLLRTGELQQESLIFLKQLCKHLDLSGSGKKGELLERLHEKATTIPIGALFESAIHP